MFSKSRIFSILAAAAVAQSAFASDGTINFTGELRDQTCTVSVNGQASPAVVSVALPTVSAGALSAAGRTTGQTAFNITLSGCTGSATAASAFFEAGATVDPTTSNLRNSATGGATLVQLQLVDAANGNVIRTGDTAQNAGTTRSPIASGGATMPYAVQYIATGRATPGRVASSVTYSINYQ